jgi:hypothetical protein
LPNVGERGAVLPLLVAAFESHSKSGKISILKMSNGAMA